ncbi:hypothetical protein FACS189427_03470 [Planctomycetales bacterium]|nr:hypothetical protein FACS189427_03470 [Planctomycetales bacterium]
MKFFWAVLVCTLLSAAVVLIQSFRLEHNNFDGVAASPAVIDFGTVHNVNSIQKVFNIFNGSDSEVEIVDIRPSCGCATIGLPQRTIPPHKSIPVTITLDLQGTFGAKEFAVSLITNHPATPAVRLLLSGTITVTDLAGTLPFDIGVFAPNETIDKIIPLKQTLVNPSVKITKVSNKELEQLDISVVLKDSSSSELRIHGTAPSQADEFQISATLTTDGPYWKNTTVAITGAVQSPWSIEPIVYLGFVSPSQSTKKTVKIKRQFSSSAVLIKDIGITSQKDELKKNIVRAKADEFEIELELPHSGQQGEFADTAEIRFYEDSKPIMLKTEIKASFL